jgi:MoaA/NifB/PqqE/SkfB family radical SAM enzyme
MLLTRIRRATRTAGRRIREARVFVKAMQSPRHPIAAHIIPTRRCNLSCGYCNEFDRVSHPVPTEDMLRRVDALAALGTTIITLSGGEPLLHPDADAIIRRIRTRGLIATLITNGTLLTPARIQRLNRAGLDSLQISIDNVTPDEVSKKSLKVLDQKLRWLAEHAEFDVVVNSVIGCGVGHPEDALAIARRARALGFRSTVGLLHDGHGQLDPLSERAQAVRRAIAALPRPLFSFDRYNRFQDNLARGLANTWHCRAGSRYLYVCEEGLVHYCSQQRGRPGIPLEAYTRQDLAREHATVKDCAPYCTIGCVHRVAMLDALREQPRETLSDWFGGAVNFPLPVRLLVRAFVLDPPHRAPRR